MLVLYEGEHDHPELRVTRDQYRRVRDAVHKRKPPRALEVVELNGDPATLANLATIYSVSFTADVET